MYSTTVDVYRMGVMIYTLYDEKTKTFSPMNTKAYLSIRKEIEDVRSKMKPNTKRVREHYNSFWRGSYEMGDEEAIESFQRIKRVLYKQVLDSDNVKAIRNMLNNWDWLHPLYDRYKTCTSPITFKDKGNIDGADVLMMYFFGAGVWDGTQWLQTELPMHDVLSRPTTLQELNDLAYHRYYRAFVCKPPARNDLLTLKYKDGSKQTVLVMKAEPMEESEFSMVCYILTKPFMWADIIDTAVAVTVSTRDLHKWDTI